jgi:hypothetical protein
MRLLSITKLKAEAGRIVDRALNGEPQYVVRRDGVVVIVRAQIFAAEDRPAGYFRDAYGDERLAQLEARLSKSVKFHPER